MAIDCVLDADGCCAAWRLQAHASALFRPGYLASYVCSWGQPLCCSGKRCSCFKLEQEAFPVLAEQPALALCQACRALQPQFSSGPSRLLAGHGLPDGLLGCGDVLELIFLSLSPLRARPSHGAAIILPPAPATLSGWPRSTCLGGLSRRFHSRASRWHPSRLQLCLPMLSLARGPVRDGWMCILVKSFADSAKAAKSGRLEPDSADRLDRNSRIPRSGFSRRFAPLLAPWPSSIKTILTPAASRAFGGSLCTIAAATDTGIPASVSPLKPAAHWHECQQQEAAIGL